MVMQEHSSTSMAVKAVIQEIKRRLSLRFNFLEGMPEFFYDFDKGLSDQFKQYYAKTPIHKREDSWICLSYSYDAYDKSSVQSRNGLYWYRPVTHNLRRKVNVIYVDLPLLCSLCCNDSKTYNALHNFIQQRFDWSFTTEYEDLLWPEHVKAKLMPEGWYIRPSIPNGKLYMCSKSGISGDSEPSWNTEVGSITIDNTCEWTCIQPDLLKVKAGSFVSSGTSIKNPIEDGIFYQLDFGFTLSFTDYDDDGELNGIITEAVLNLLDMYNPEFRLARIAVQGQS